MWIQSVFNAISEVESRRPGAVQRVAALNSDDEWTDDQWNDYNFVAGAIVEPFSFPGGESEDEDWFYQHCEEHGSGQVKANIDGVENCESWKKVCDLVDIMGY
jgi:hypothetical protein